MGMGRWMRFRRAYHRGSRNYFYRYTASLDQHPDLFRRYLIFSSRVFNWIIKSAHPEERVCNCWDTRCDLDRNGDVSLLDLANSNHRDQQRIKNAIDSHCFWK